MKEFKIEEMGMYFKGIQFIRLSKDFIDKHLPLNIIHWETLPYETDIQCPFCRQSVLILTKREREICDVHICHTGDSYEFKCKNNSKCNSLFTYTNTWLYC